MLPVSGAMALWGSGDWTGVLELSQLVQVTAIPAPIKMSALEDAQPDGSHAPVKSYGHRPACESPRGRNLRAIREGHGEFRSAADVGAAVVGKRPMDASLKRATSAAATIDAHSKAASGSGTISLLSSEKVL